MTVIWHAEIDDKEIVLSQNGRYLEFTKRNSPIVYKYDMADHVFLCYTRATGEPRTRHRGETNRWFKAKLTTEDDKLASMFVYACALSGNSERIVEIMTEFGNEKMEKFEQWVAIGTHFRIGQYGWGSGRTIARIVNRPADVSAGVRNFISSRTWNINELNDFTTRICGNDDDVVDKIFTEIAETPEYIDDFTMIENGEATNYLTESSIAIRRIVNMINTYNLEVKRLLIYIHYLNNVEYVNIEDILEKYPQYLEKELERQDGRRNRMYKFPRYFISEVHTQEEKERRLRELDNYDPNNEEYSNEYLEYRDDDYFIMIPRSPEDVREEGRQQGHCVASHFMDYIANGDTAVVFMRRTSDPNTSLITIEVRNNHIRQACIGDNDPVPEQYRNWIRNWASMKGVEVTHDSWRTTLGFH